MAWLELADRQDQLRLLALIASQGKSHGEYDPPSVTIAADLATPDRSDDVAPGANRRAEVLAFLAQTGGG